MNKAFDATNGTARKLLVTRLNDNLHFIVEDDDSRELGVVLPPETAAGIMLAVAEAADITPTPANERSWGESYPGFPIHLRDIAGMLADHVAADAEKLAKETADREALWQEASDLYNSVFPSEPCYENAAKMPEHLRDGWVRAALKARELHGVTK